MRPPRRARAAGAAAVAVLGLLAGCGQEAPASPAAAAPSSTVPSGAAAETPTKSPVPPSATVEPATGPLLRLDHVSMHAPAGYQHSTAFLSWEKNASSKDAGSVDVINLTELPWAGGGLGLAIRSSRKSDPNTHYKRLPDVELDGATAYHLRGSSDRLSSKDQYAAINGQRIATITFELDNIHSRAHRDQAIAATLASFRWHLDEGSEDGA